MTRTSGAPLLMLGTLAALAAGAPARAQVGAGYAASDRYGPMDAPTPAPRMAAFPGGASAGVAHLRTRFLSWPGKAGAGPALAVTAVAAPVLREPLRAEPRPFWRARSRPAETLAVRRDGHQAYALADRQAHPPLPSSIYDDGAARTAALRSGDVADQTLGRQGASRYPGSRYQGASYQSASNQSGSYRAAGYPNAGYRATGHQGADPQPVQPMAARVASMAAPVNPFSYGGGVRFYSVHRQFGLKPDPAPIPPQFFAVTPDLSDPPGPSPLRRTLVSSGGSALAGRSAAEAEDAQATAQP